jgi:hypothetical protein
MRHLAVVAVLLVAVVAGAPAVHVGVWCAWYDAYTYNCGFNTFQQCLDTISGQGGYCARNVHAAWPAPAPAPVRKPRRRRND